MTEAGAAAPSMDDACRDLVRRATAATSDSAEKVHALIEQATSNQNLCQMYTGWCAWW